jgi:4-amino-4-deoxy-L-arabinose transferase-like glycosyltransferase
MLGKMPSNLVDIKPDMKQMPDKLVIFSPSIRSAKTKSPHLIWWIVILAFLLRGVLLLVAAGHISRVFQPDSQTYIDPAIKLLSSGMYPVDSALRTPVYPFFIAILYWIGGQNAILIVAAQVVLGTLSVLLSYYLGIKVISRPVALLGAFLLTVSIESITSVFYVLTETLFTFLFLAGMISWMNGYKERNKYWLAVAAILMGFSALCRPVAVYFPLILTIGLLFDKGTRRSSRMIHAALFLGIFIISLVPWLVRNIYIVGSPTISTISSYNMLFYEAASLEANSRQISETQVRDEYTSRVAQVLADHDWVDTEGNRSRVDSMLARQIILADPIRFLYVHLKGDLNGLLPDVTSLTEILGATVGGKGTLSILNQYGILAAIRNYFGGQTWLLGLLLPLIIFLGLEYIFSLGSTVEILRHHNWLTISILVTPVLYFLILPGAASLPRFRVPVMPYVCLLAGAGLQVAWTYYKGWKRKKRSAQL